MQNYILKTSDVKFAAFLIMKKKKPDVHYEVKISEGKKRTTWSWHFIFESKEECLENKREWLMGEVGQYSRIFDELMNQIKNTVVDEEELGEDM